MRIIGCLWAFACWRWLDYTLPRGLRRKGAQQRVLQISYRTFANS